MPLKPLGKLSVSWNFYLPSIVREVEQIEKYNFMKKIDIKVLFLFRKCKYTLI